MLGAPAPDYFELRGDKAVSSFIKSIESAKNANPAGASVLVYLPEDYAKMKLFVTEDGKAGVAVKPDGDIVSVFNTPGGTKGIAFSALQLAVQNGGTKLDAFDTVLPIIYAKAGFTPVSRLRWDDAQAPAGWSKKTFKNFNSGEPDVVFMAYDRTRDNLRGSRTPYVAGEGKLVGSYDEAVALQDEAVKKFAPKKKSEQLSDVFKSSLLLSWRGVKFDPDQARDESGKWTGGVPGSHGDLPPEAGTVKIPEGTVRLYHQTDEANLLSIAKEGLNIAHAKGIEGPRAVYAGENPFYGKVETTPTVEFFVPKDKWSSPFVLQDVPPENIVAVHFPWHRHARYLDNPEDIKRALAGEFDFLLQDDSDEAKGVRYIKDKYGKKAKAFDPDQVRDEQGRWTTGGAGTGSPAARQGMVPDYSNPKTLASMRRTAQAAASDVHAIATSIDKLVTDDMKEVVGENMRLAGLSNRIKSEESLARKIFDESVDDQIDVREKAATIKDALRYTAVSSDKDYTSNVVRGVSALKAKGYTLMQVKSRWGEGTDYQGINAFFKTPGGQVFELQFHTTRSFYVKSKLTRDDYKIWRSKTSTRKQRTAAYKRMVEKQKTVHVPSGVGNLSFAVSP